MAMAKILRIRYFYFFHPSLTASKIAQKIKSRWLKGQGKDARFVKG
jgi:hypothetical protein